MLEAQVCNGTREKGSKCPWLLFLPLVEVAGDSADPVTAVVLARDTLVWARPPTTITGAKRITDLSLLH